jgi:hypothetical protein
MDIKNLKLNPIKQPIVLVGGESGQGKSTFCSQAPNNYTISFEEIGLNSYVDDYIARPFNDFIELLKSTLSKDSIAPIQSITIDSLNALVKKIEAEELAKMGEKAYKTYGAGVSNVRTQLDSMMRLLIAIRVKHNVRIHLISHAKNKNLNDPYDEEVKVKGIDLADGYYNTILGNCDISLLIDDELEYIREQDGTIKGISGKKKVLRINDDKAQGKNRMSYMNEKIDINNGNFTAKDGTILNIKKITLPKEVNSSYVYFDALLHSSIQFFNKKGVKNG